MKLKNSTPEQFLADLGKRKIICFGAGSTLFERSYRDGEFEHLEEHIAFLVDNDVQKQGQSYKYRNHCYDIKGAEALKQIDISDYVLLITCMYYEEIYLELKDEPELQDLECYMYHVMCTNPELDVEKYFAKEIEKHPYKDWKQILQNLKLKDKHKGKRCFVIGNGPSLTKEDLESLKDEITFAANRIYLMFEHTDWRPNYYVCIDYDLYNADCEKINQIEADLRFVPIERAIAAGQVYSDVTYYHRKVNPTHLNQGTVLLNAECNFSEDCEEIVYGAETVLYDAIQWAVYMGFSEIYLLGVDCSYAREMSLGGDITVSDQEENFAEDCNLDRSHPAAVFVMHQAFQKAKEVCERKGKIIKNATRGGKLEVFERIDLDLLLR